MDGQVDRIDGWADRGMSRWTDRWADRGMGRGTDRCMGRQRDGQVDR